MIHLYSQARRISPAISLPFLIDHEVNEAFTLMSSDYYIAISLGTPAAVVNTWRSALQAMQQDGTYEAIHRKWFP